MKAVIPGSLVKQRLSFSSSLEIDFKKVQNWSSQKFLHLGGDVELVVVVAVVVIVIVAVVVVIGVVVVISAISKIKF